MRNILLIVCIGIVLLTGVSFFFIHSNISRGLTFESVRHFVASVFFVDSSTSEILHQKYAAAENGEKFRVLIVPGHDDEYSGTEFWGIREADMTAELGGELANMLSKDPRFVVTLSRTHKDGYNPIFQEYFATQRQMVNDFMENQIATMDDLEAKGLLQTVTGVPHRTAVSEVAYHLYAINKWANDNKMDLVIHIHFNNYPRKDLTTPGIYKGFTIYIPEGQYSNSKGSQAIANSVFNELSKEYSVSTLSHEDLGVVPEQDLIAIGSHNSLDSAGMLIEYGYIYEPQFLTLQKRTQAISNLALLTYNGVENFFNPIQ
ncbi:MAG: N-acetylmuramoyl-L-alanine amidase [Candidatus Pacebacteria bacterium]|nr:N-acetylmuramoyl-L-alanine amidase [Candidatus Paceibacterota bacterium]MDD5356852.1 N-acetylmuramoyl-L-alanine amidase [Candidatus Paceibacterota bacterium]